jgi:hypothetical protein
MSAQRGLSMVSTARILFRFMFPSIAKMAPGYFGIEVWKIGKGTNRKVKM